MATQTTDQQNALKDAMARAKQIAAKLQQQASGVTAEPVAIDQDESRKRSFQETFGSNMMNEAAKRTEFEAVDHTDPKVIAQQIANSLVQRAGLGSMLVQEVTIPNKLVGLVIGRGGEMINKLQSESGAKIQVAPDPPPEMAHMDRQVTITGMVDAVNKAKNIIEEIKSEGKVPERLLIGGGNPGEYSLDMMIAASKVGLVIGKGGETIKGLQERAGCKMVLFQDGEYASAPEKPLRISGEQPKVMYGKQLVQDLLTMKELEAINPDKHNQEGGENYEEVQVPRDAVGFVIGAKGASINQIQQMTGCRIQFKNDMEGDFKIAMLSGNPQQVSLGKQKLDEILQSHQDRRSGNWSGPRGPRPGGWGNAGQSESYNSPGPRPSWGGPDSQGPGGPRHWGPGSRGGSNQMGGSDNLPPGHKHMVIHVPANKCGLVIGKGGETLKYIHNETKVNIEINREVPEMSPFRVFHLKGNEEQIEKAQIIIREKVGDQSVTAKPADGEQSGNDGQNQWSDQQQGGGWSQQNQQQWGGQQQAGWNQQQPSQQWNQQGAWNQQQQGGNWNNQQGGSQSWDQQQQQQPSQQQQWQPPNAAQGQWQNQPQQQWGQQQQGFANAQSAGQPAATSNSGTDPAQQQTAQAGGQPDYSAAWALYYQQQSQYYQQYGMQPPATGAAPTSTAGAVSTTQTPGTPAGSNASQTQAIADYQAKLAEYYKSFGQQPPAQQQQQ